MLVKTGSKKECQAAADQSKVQLWYLSQSNMETQSKWSINIRRFPHCTEMQTLNLHHTWALASAV